MSYMQGHELNPEAGFSEEMHPSYINTVQTQRNVRITTYLVGFLYDVLQTLV